MIHLCYRVGRLLGHLLSQCDPFRRQLLTYGTPGRVKLDEEAAVARDLLEIVVREFNDRAEMLRFGKRLRRFVDLLR